MTHVLIICLVVLISYCRAIFHATYVIDDEDIFNAQIIPKNKWHRLWLQFRGQKYSQPQIEHLLHTLVHLINCILVYIAFGHNQISFMAALLFAVNPAGTQGSIWLSGRPYAVATTFVLAMLALPVLSPLFYGLSAFWSLNAILAPLIFLRSPYWWWIFLIPIYLMLAKTHKQTIKRRLTMRTGIEKQLRWQKGILFFKTLGYYTCLCLIPTRLGVYHTYLYVYGLSKKETDKCERPDRFFFIGLFITYLLITNYIWNYNFVVFGLYWFFLFIIQWCNCPITIQQTTAERYLYLPMIGLMYALTSVISGLPHSEAIFTAFFVYYFMRLQFQIPAYYNIDNCINYNMINFSDMYACWTWKGNLEKRHGRHFLALENWFIGWKMRKIDFRLNNNIAVLLTDMGFYDDAEEFLKNAEQNMIPEQKEIVMAFIENERRRIRQRRNMAIDKAKAQKKLNIPK